MYSDYIKGLNGSSEVLEWANTALAARIKKVPETTVVEIEHILDYLCSSQGPPKLKRMSYIQAKDKSEQWTKTLQKKGAHIKETKRDVKVIHEYADGSKIIQLVGKKAYEREGYLMRHCIGSYADKSITIYSYRDSDNMPHATFELCKQGKEIVQLKGKGNGTIHPKYITPILDFFTSIKLTVTDREMEYLGYYNPPKDIKAIIKANFSSQKIATILGKEYYVT